MRGAVELSPLSATMFQGPEADSAKPSSRCCSGVDWRCGAKREAGRAVRQRGARCGALFAARERRRLRRGAGGGKQMGAPAEGSGPLLRGFFGRGRRECRSPSIREPPGHGGSAGRRRSLLPGHLAAPPFPSPGVGGDAAAGGRDAALRSRRYLRRENEQGRWPWGRVARHLAPARPEGPELPPGVAQLGRGPDPEEIPVREEGPGAGGTSCFPVCSFTRREEDLVTLCEAFRGSSTNACISRC